MKYRNGEVIELGDSIEHAGSSGMVIGVRGENGSPQTMVGFEWIAQADRGLWVQFANGAIVRFNDVNEDWKFVARSETPR